MIEKNNNSLLTNPLLNIMVLLLVGTISVVVTTKNTDTPDPAQSELLVNWVPLIIVAVNILIYLLIYRVRPEKAHLITIGGVIGLLYYLGKLWMTTGI